MATRAAARNGTRDIHAFPFEFNVSSVHPGKKVKDNPQHNPWNQTNGVFQRDRMLEIQVRQKTLQGMQFMLKISDP